MDLSLSTISYDAGSESDSLPEEILVVEESEEVFEYPWPCPENWPSGPTPIRPAVIKFDPEIVSLTSSGGSLISPFDDHFKKDIHSAEGHSVPRPSKTATRVLSRNNSVTRNPYGSWAPPADKAMPITGRSMSSISSRR